MINVLTAIKGTGIELLLVSGRVSAACLHGLGALCALGGSRLQRNSQVGG